MTDTFALPRKLVILGIILPLAGIVGYLLASPTDVDSVAFIGLLLHVLAAPFKSRARLEVEIVFLRHQLNLLRPRRVTDWIALALVIGLVTGTAVSGVWLSRYAVAVHRLTRGIGDRIS